MANPLKGLDEKLVDLARNAARSAESIFKPKAPVGALQPLCGAAYLGQCEQFWAQLRLQGTAVAATAVATDKRFAAIADRAYREHNQWAKLHGELKHLPSVNQNVDALSTRLKQLTHKIDRLELVLDRVLARHQAGRLKEVEGKARTELETIDKQLLDERLKAVADARQNELRRRDEELRAQQEGHQAAFESAMTDYLTRENTKKQSKKRKKRRKHSKRQRELQTESITPSASEVSGFFSTGASATIDPDAEAQLEDFLADVTTPDSGLEEKTKGDRGAEAEDVSSSSDGGGGGVDDLVSWRDFSTGLSEKQQAERLHQLAGDLGIVLVDTQRFGSLETSEKQRKGLYRAIRAQHAAKAGAPAGAVTQLDLDSDY